jgi:DNA-binding transcriptional ArsR family regulator
MEISAQEKDMSLEVLDYRPTAPVDDELPLSVAEMADRAAEAAALLKALSHEGRLMILCHLASGEKSVSELEALLDARQAAVSQQLARLRSEGLVEGRREGKTIFYTIRDPKAAAVVAIVYRLYCGTAGQQ